MQHVRKTLSLRAAEVRAPVTQDDTPEDILRDAVARQTCVAAVYNLTAVQIAPHIVYTKHGDMFVDGVVVERDGNPPKELKLGTFKLAGLSAIAPTGRAFSAQPVFDRNDPKYDGNTLCVIQSHARRFRASV